MNVRLLVAAGAALMFAGGVAMAQPASTTPAAAAPAASHASTTTAVTTAPTTTHTPTTPAHATPASTPASSNSSSSTGSGAISCRTSHVVGGSCACLKAPSRHGTVQAGANGGHNMCAVPARHA